MTEAELVITTPRDIGAALAYDTKCRMTLGVLVEMIASSENRLVIAAPFIQTGTSAILDPLAYALECALERGVSVDLVSTGSGLRNVEAGRPAWVDYPGLHLFRPRLNDVNEQVLGSHAKFCIADRSSAYIGSANLTGPGLSSQFEMGVLVKGNLAQQVAAFWDYAIQIGMFVLQSFSTVL